VSTGWARADRNQALTRLCEDGAELVVIGGGITGAGVLRDAALRGLKTVLIERHDFASGTSSCTSKMIHGGLRYIAEGQLRVTRESCVERDLLAKLNPQLVRPLPFLFCSFDDGIAPWKMIAGLSLYSVLAGFQSGAFKLLKQPAVEALSRDLRKQGLRAAGLYYDQQVDDARIVLETIKDARRVGGEALCHAEVVGFEKHEGKLCAVRVLDRLNGREHLIRAAHFVNAAGPSVDRVRDLDRTLAAHELRPAKGIHVVIDRERVHADAAIAFQARDGRHMFLCPWGDVHLLGTTDAFSDELDEPRVTESEVGYVLEAANHAFPSAKLGLADVLSVYAGVRPLVADSHANLPPSSVSREHRLTEDESGLLSVAGGKLTTYRRMAEQIVDRIVARLPSAKRRRLEPCTTRERPLRSDAFDERALTLEITRRFELDERTARRLLASWGLEALELLEQAPAEERVRIGNSHFLVAEVPWSISRECAVYLSDVLERRVRLAVLARGQGLAELETLARAAQRVAGLSDHALQEQCDRYRYVVARRYQVRT
jgi:glycerol-3-phosphate dehydrogenase